MKTEPMAMELKPFDETFRLGDVARLLIAFCENRQHMTADEATIILERIVLASTFGLSFKVMDSRRN